MSEKNKEIAKSGVNCPFCKGKPNNYCNHCIHKFHDFLKALDSKDREHEESWDARCVALEAESAQLRGEVEKKQAFIDHILTKILPPGWKENDHGYVVAGEEHDRVKDKLASQSLLIEKLRLALELIQDSQNKHFKDLEIHQAFYEAQAIASEALLPQSEKKDGR